MSCPSGFAIARIKLGYLTRVHPLLVGRRLAKAREQELAPKERPVNNGMQRTHVSISFEQTVARHNVAARVSPPRIQFTCRPN